MALKKFAPKNVKICPGCPPKEITPITTPKFTMKLPANQSEKSSQVSTLKKDLDVNARVRRGSQTTLF